MDDDEKFKNCEPVIVSCPFCKDVFAFNGAGLKLAKKRASVKGKEKEEDESSKLLPSGAARASDFTVRVTTHVFGFVIEHHNSSRILHSVSSVTPCTLGQGRSPIWWYSVSGMFPIQPWVVLDLLFSRPKLIWADGKTTESTSNGTTRNGLRAAIPHVAIAPVRTTN